MAKLIGYARVSTAAQNLDAQIAALQDAGCCQVFSEKISSRISDRDRPQLQAAIESLTEGDTLVIAKLDRLGRTQHEVIACLHELQSQGWHVKTLDGLIDTAALGKMAPLVIGLLTGLAEVERDLIKARTEESIAYRKAVGLSLGGRPKTYNADQARLVVDLRTQGHSLRRIASMSGLPLATVQRILKGAA